VFSRVYVLCLCLVFLFVSCPNPVPQVAAVTGIRLKADSLSALAGGSVKLSVAVEGIPDSPVVWSITAGTGTLSSNLGKSVQLFAPSGISEPQNVTVEVVSALNEQIKDSLTIRVSPVLTGVFVSASRQSVLPSESVELIALAQGGATTDFDWRIISGGGSLINLSGQRTELLPPTVRNLTEIVVQAVSTIDSSKSGTATILVRPRRAKIAAGTYHSMSIKTDGTVWTWGNNIFGMLGDGSEVDRYLPVSTGLTDVINVAAGTFHSLAVRVDGSVWSWGENLMGQLGLSDFEDRNVPTRVTLPVEAGEIVEVSAGSRHSLALSRNGTVWAWGENADGQLGNGSEQNTAIPTKVLNLENVLAVRAGGYFSLALLENGEVWGWGENNKGLLGGTASFVSNPKRILGLGQIKEIAVGQFHALALDSNNEVWAWGWNNRGQLGIDSLVDQISPIKLGLSQIQTIYAGESQSAAIQKDGSVLHWGENNWFNDGSSLEPVKLPKKVSNQGLEVAFGLKHKLVSRKNQSLLAWGGNFFGQVGNNTNTLVSIPIEVIFEQASP
jgi:alpha-tubulin suppressor-like RCC1 family protein